MLSWAVTKAACTWVKAVVTAVLAAAALVAAAAADLAPSAVATLAAPKEPLLPLDKEAITATPAAVATKMPVETPPTADVVAAPAPAAD